MSDRVVLQVNTLGVPQVALGEQPLDVQGKSLALLAYLAVEGQTTREALADLLWPDQPAEAARRNLRVLIHRLRQSPAGAWLRLSSQALQLAPGAEVDVHLFRAALADGDFRRACGFARGNFLDHLSLPNAPAFDEWREQTASTLRDEQWRALDGYAQALAAQGQPAAALSLREQAVRLDPLRERSVRALMELLISLGQFDAAQNAYVSLARRLQEELGLSPLPATQVLRERLEVLRSSAPGTAALPENTTAFPLPLVGRESQRRRLEGSPLLLVLGEAGVGKSKLVQEVAGRDALILRAVRELTPLPFGALFELLRSVEWQGCPEPLRQVLSSLQQETSLAAPTDRARLLDALAQALNGVLGSRTLIVEDIHWLDSGTLESVFLALFRGARRVWLTGRWSELQERPELLRLLGSSQVPRLTLTELTGEDVAELIRQMAGQPAPLFSRRLYSATAGNPLFLVETLRGLRESGELSMTQGVWRTPYDTFTEDYAEVPVPESVTAAIGERTERLGGPTRQLLQAGALWGEAFPAELVAATCGLETGAALDALERAETARLVIPEGPNYRFGHDLYRREMIRSLGGPRRRFLHSQLARLAPPGTSPVKLAEHHEQAGEHPLAWPFWRSAALEAERLFAHEEAVGLYRRALADSPPQDVQFDLHLAISQLQRYTDDLPGQQQSLRHLRQLAEQSTDPEVKARCARRCAVFYTECDEYAQAVQEVQQALHALGQQISRERRAELLLEGGAALACLSRWDEAHAMLLAAREEGQGGAPMLHTNTLYWLGYCRLERGDAQGAEEAYRECLERLPQGQISRGRVLNLWKRGLALRRLGRLEEAQQALEQARAEGTTLNSGSLLGVVLAELGLVLCAQGDCSGAAHLAELATPLVAGDTEGTATLTALTAALQHLNFPAASG
ncbi:ATP-binding protein [Deinococcus fonticola]|uniref:ATP-binding protein n=1 Tax=Deinococcus fonticola TaxID=2528713 RepID=UPI0010757F74|nr:BTAD domain-containing putative transcriptional regulator [Deinococcus fonticola]